MGAIFNSEVLLDRQAENELAESINLCVAPWFNTPWGMMNAWRNAAPFLHLYPLPDTAFNRAKPPTAWLEASAVGAACIGPDLPEWQKPGMIHYSPGAIAFPGKRDFKTVLLEEMGRFSDGALHPQVAAAREALVEVK